MINANGRCSAAAAAHGHPGLLQQQCGYELQHFLALKYVFFAAESGQSAAEQVSTVHPPPPQESSYSNLADRRQDQDETAGQEERGTAEVGTCTTLDEHVVSAIHLASHMQHPAAYTPLSRLRRPLSHKAAVFVPAHAKPTRASRRRRRRIRRDCAMQKASLQTLDVLGAHARRIVSCSMEQAAALEQPVRFSADQLLALNLPLLARKRGGAHMRRLALRERQRAAVPTLQAATRRWLARRLLTRLRVDNLQVIRLRELQAKRESITQRVHEQLRAAGPCPKYPATGPLGEWAVRLWAWMQKACLGAATSATALASQVSQLPLEVQQVCRSLSTELQHALGHFYKGTVQAVESDYGEASGEHGGRILQAVLGSISSIIVPQELQREPRLVRAQWSGGRGKGRRNPRQSVVT